MGATGSEYLYNWCPLADNVNSTEHRYVPVDQNNNDQNNNDQKYSELDTANKLLHQQLCITQYSIKQLSARLDNTEHKIEILTKQQQTMEADMVLV